MLPLVSSFVSAVECVRANTGTPNSVSWHQFSVQVFSNNLCFLFDGIRALLNCSVHFSTWCSAYPEWWKYTLISLMRWKLTKIVVVMARSLMYSVSMILCRHFLFSIIPTPSLLSYFPAPMNTCLWCLPIFRLGKASKARSVILHPVCNLRARKSCLRFFHLSALMPCFFVARWTLCLFLLFFHFLCFPLVYSCRTDLCYCLPFCFCCLPFCCSNHCFRSPSCFCRFCCCWWCCLCVLQSLSYWVARHRQRFEICVCLFLFLSDLRVHAFLFHCHRFLDVFMFDTATFEGVPNWVVCGGVERLHEVHCSNPHFDSPLMASLFNHSVRRQMIHRLMCTSEPCLINYLDLIKSGVKSPVQFCRKQFVQRKQRADRAIVFTIFIVTYFCVSLLFLFFAMLLVYILCVL